MRRERWESFPNEAGNRPHLELRRGKQGTSGVVAGLTVFLSSGDRYVGELLELQQGCERPLEVPEVRCD